MVAGTLLMLGASLILGQAPAEAPGRRVELSNATLFVPEAYRPKDDRIHIILHLHGAPSVVEPAVAAVTPTAVLVAFNRKGLSSVYTKPFSDQTLLTRLIDDALRALKEAGVSKSPKLDRLTVSTFSAGFGGAREMLKDAMNFDRIDALILADSLHCGYEGDPGLKKVDPKLMEGFRRFAEAAAQGRKSLVITHSAQVPGGYASTTETADDLIRHVGATVESGRVEVGRGWFATRRASRGRFLVLGFGGKEGEDHLKHLRQIRDVWKSLPD